LLRFLPLATLPRDARAEETELTIMVFVGIQNLPWFAAQSQGFFAKRGLPVDMKIAPGSEVFKALAGL
jgi:ABC-type nitrate/sulfonate/bicarbonate transport system substrate-binding protein